MAERNKGFALGAAAVMQKPISREELYETLVEPGPVSALAATARSRCWSSMTIPRRWSSIAVRIEGLASTVLRAYGGREAIETARRELPDLIVLDLMMPEVNGFDVVEALKQQPDTARIPILVVTAKQITAEDRARLNGYVVDHHGKGRVRPRPLHRRGPAGHVRAPGGRLTWPKSWSSKTTPPT